MKTTFLSAFAGAMLTIYTVNSNAQANQRLSNLISPTAVNQSLLPGANDVKNLGSDFFQWKDLYIHQVFLDEVPTIQAPGIDNYFFGGNAGNVLVKGLANTGTGSYALSHITDGFENTADGCFALYSNTTGNGNTANGYITLSHNTTGSYNTADGFGALLFNTTGFWNTASGYSTLYNNTTGASNTASGVNALFSNTNGTSNTATGVNALYANAEGNSNTADGFGALYNNVTGYYNTASGVNVLAYNNTGTYNTASGVNALYFSTAGHNNTAFGYGAGFNITTGNLNTFIGNNANCGSFSKLINSTALGNGATVNKDNTVRIGNCNVISIGGFANWSNISDGRVKKNIKNNVPGLAFVNKLEPITYNLDLGAVDKITQTPLAKDKDGNVIQPSAEELAARKEKEEIVYSGFVAQDVEKAALAVNYNFSGVDAAKNDHDLYGLRYTDLIVPLVKAVQELSARNDSLQKQIDELKALMIAASQNSSSSQLSMNAISNNALLEQNIPNPFSHTTTINYILPQSRNGGTTAQIIVTDNSGNTVKQINLPVASQGISGTGKGSVNVDLTSITSGNYNYSLVIDGKIICTKQMVLVR
jgi:hypothetical protein